MLVHGDRGTVVYEDDLRSGSGRSEPLLDIFIDVVHEPRVRELAIAGASSVPEVLLRAVDDEQAGSKRAPLVCDLL